MTELDEYLAEVTAQRVLEVAREVVAEAGEDYVYAPQPDPRDVNGLCLYVDAEDKPSCIIGRIAHRLGVPVEVLRSEGDLWIDESVPSLVQTRAADPLLSALGLPGHLVPALANAQWSQDQSQPWGAVLRDLEGELS